MEHGVVLADEHNNNRVLPNLWHSSHREKEDIMTLNLRVLTRALAPDCVRALLQNTSVGTLQFSDYGHFPAFPTMEAADWLPFWNATVASCTLKQIDLTSTPLRFSNIFLNEIPRSSSITTVSLNCMTVNVNSLCTFLRMTKSVTRLELFNVNFEETLSHSSTEAALNLSSSMTENASLEVLNLAYIQPVYQVALFHGLTGHTRIRKLELDRFVDRELPMDIIVGLFES